MEFATLITPRTGQYIYISITSNSQTNVITNITRKTSSHDDQYCKQCYHECKYHFKILTSQSNLTKVVKESSHILHQYLLLVTQTLHDLHVQIRQQTCPGSNVIVVMTTNC